MIYAAQYRYSGKDRFDITVKGNCEVGKLYAPTWNMVSGIKNGTLTHEEYTAQYYNLLIQRWATSGEEMISIVDKVRNQDVTLVCFCPTNTFCHRYLLVKFLQHNWGVKYGGERE